MTKHAGPVTAETLVEMHNDRRFSELVPRVLSTMKHAVIAAERTRWIRVAAMTLNKDQYTEDVRNVIASLVSRSRALRGSFPGYIVADSTPDGALAVALLVNGRKLPSRRTFERAIRSLRQKP